MKFQALTLAVFCVAILFSCSKQKTIVIKLSILTKHERMFNNELEKSLY